MAKTSKKKAAQRNTKQKVAPAPSVEDAENAELIRAVYRVAVPVLLAFVAVFTVGVYAYATYGGPWVDGLDEQIAEVVAKRADVLAERGQRAEAIEQYRLACTLRFDDPVQGVWVRRRLADELIREKQFAEVCDVALDMLALDFPGTSDWTARAVFAGGTKGLLNQADGPALIEASQSWLEHARMLDDSASESQGLFALGQGLALEGRHAEALEALTASNAITASPERALAIGEVLIALGRASDATSWLESARDKGQGTTKHRARDLLSDVSAAETPE